MSVSDDSDSFLSADEGDAKLAEDDSSDITLSSDEDDATGDGKKTGGAGDSSDITLSSDEDTSAVATKSKSLADVKSKPASIVDSDPAAQVKNAPASEMRNAGKVGVSVQQPTSGAGIQYKSSGMPEPIHSPSITREDKTIDKADSTAGCKSEDKSSPLIAQQNVHASQPEETLEEVPLGACLQSETVGNSANIEIKENITNPNTVSVTEVEPAQGKPEESGKSLISRVESLSVEEGGGWSDVDDVLECVEHHSTIEVRKADSPLVEDEDVSATDQSVHKSQSNHEELSVESTQPPPPTANEPTQHTQKDIDDNSKPAPLHSTITDIVSTGPTDEPSANNERQNQDSVTRPVRQRIERRQRRGPMKLGAKKLSNKLPSSIGKEGDADGKKSVDASVSQAKLVGSNMENSIAKNGAETLEQSEQDGWGGWESWGVSLLSSARDVTKTLVETVETGFGAPDPEHMAQINHQEQRQLQEVLQDGEPSRGGDASRNATGGDDGGGDGGLGGWFGGVSRVLGQTSSLMVSTGLDTLEAIGKKTMTVLQDDQLGIHGTIKELSGNAKPSLSQTLREARQQRGDVVPGRCPTQRDSPDAPPPTFSRLFDQSEGTVHLEALEMLSARTQGRVTAARSRCEESTGALLDMVQDICNGEAAESAVGADNFEMEVAGLCSRLDVPSKPARLLIAQSSSVSWLEQQHGSAARSPSHVLHRSVLTSAELAAGLAEYCHKFAELLLVSTCDAATGGADAGGKDGVGVATALADLVALVSGEASALAARYAELLTTEKDETAAAATTDIYLEASYMQQFCGTTLQLMVPVLQMSVLNR